ncbi:MAG: sigma-54 dependent transcriptional regulator [Bacteroidota bacterium]
MKNILIIDDEEKLRGLLAKIIKLEGFEVFEAGDAKAGFKKLGQHHIDVIICDVKLPDANGVELAKEIKAKCPTVEIIMLTAYGNIADGVQSIKNGAFDYIIKGDDNNKIIPLIGRAMEKVALAERIQQLEKQVGERYSFEKIAGRSKALLQAVELAGKVAITDTTVLLAGETGTGKEVFAQAIHQASLKRNKPYVAVNCAAISKDLLESELFGYKAGAFTGAAKDKKGLFEEANQGSIFLDEIGEMPLDLQAKLLRVLETGEFMKVGESKTTHVDVRIISATNRDLKQEIEKGHFRHDLYYRLSAFTINLPSLKERISDIELLAEHFLSRYAAKVNKQITGFHADYILSLKQYHWPGNIRELKNVIERSVILSDTKELGRESLPMELQNTAPATKADSLFSISGVEKLHIQKVLNHTNGNKTETARLLGIGLTTLYRKIEEYKLQ